MSYGAKIVPSKPSAVLSCWQPWVSSWWQSYVYKPYLSPILFNAVVGAVDATHWRTCQPSTRSNSSHNTTPGVLGTLLTGVPIGIATCALSLGTNVLATLLVAYKAWCVLKVTVTSSFRLKVPVRRQSRRRLRHYFCMGSRTSQVQKLLSLLIESGAVYSALWVSVSCATSCQRTCIAHSLNLTGCHCGLPGREQFFVCAILSIAVEISKHIWHYGERYSHSHYGMFNISP